MKVNILGQDYEIRTLTEKEYPKLKGANGMCECYSKEIILNADCVDDDDTYANLQGFKDKVLRHEVIHAYFHEMGLRGYMEDEELVDLLALQIPKMAVVFEDLGILEVTN